MSLRVTIPTTSRRFGSSFSRGRRVETRRPHARRSSCGGTSITSRTSRHRDSGGMGDRSLCVWTSASRPVLTPCTRMTSTTSSSLWSGVWGLTGSRRCGPPSGPESVRTWGSHRPSLPHRTTDGFSGPGGTTASAGSRRWQEQVKAALQGAELLPPGPVGLQLSFRVHPRRGWVNLWKERTTRSIRSWDGRSPTYPYHPRDGRVVRLRPHVAVNPHVGWDVPFVIRARQASLDWPEVGWFASMSPESRVEWLRSHELRFSRPAKARHGTAEGPPGQSA